ncbi:MAG: hypothetical protein EA342_20265 [Leptolyngbya sp. LCM1.Bin17]|nr:MAG: hypothetical protein EA342_20265 [Leptolyngbya sp. LCM1.Bin17]
MSDSKEVWAPVHAWQALGQLKAEAAMEPLISIFNKKEEIERNRFDPPCLAGIPPKDPHPGIWAAIN